MTKRAICSVKPHDFSAPKKKLSSSRVVDRDVILTLFFLLRFLV